MALQRALRAVQPWNVLSFALFLAFLTLNFLGAWALPIGGGFGGRAMSTRVAAGSAQARAGAGAPRRNSFAPDGRLRALQLEGPSLRARK